MVFFQSIYLQPPHFLEIKLCQFLKLFFFFLNDLQQSSPAYLCIFSLDFYVSISSLYCKIIPRRVELLPLRTSLGFCCVTSEDTCAIFGAPHQTSFVLCLLFISAQPYYQDSRYRIFLYRKSGLVNSFLVPRLCCISVQLCVFSDGRHCESLRVHCGGLGTKPAQSHPRL